MNGKYAECVMSIYRNLCMGFANSTYIEFTTVAY
jgi:hypothetical protein